MDESTILIIENLPHNNVNINKCVKVNTEKFPVCYRVDVIVANGDNHWEFSIFVDTLDDDIILTDCQSFFDYHTSNRDNLNLNKKELRIVKEIVNKYGINHKYSESECINELFKIIKPENVEKEVKDFIECLKEISIKLNMETSEQFEVKYVETIKEYEKIKKEEKINKIFDSIKIGVIIAVVLFFIFLLIYPIQVILIMFGIGIIALIIKMIIYMCTFWLPGGDFWK